MQSINVIKLRHWLPEAHKSVLKKKDFCTILVLPSLDFLMGPEYQHLINKLNKKFQRN